MYMIKIVEKIVAIVLHNNHTSSSRASVPMWKAKYPLIGFIAAVIFFLTIFALKDYIKTLNAFNENKTPSPFLGFKPEKNDSFPYP